MEPALDRPELTSNSGGNMLAGAGKRLPLGLELLHTPLSEHNYTSRSETSCHTEVCRNLGGVGLEVLRYQVLIDGFQEDLIGNVALGWCV